MPLVLAMAGPNPLPLTLWLGVELTMKLLTLDLGALLFPSITSGFLVFAVCGRF